MPILLLKLLKTPIAQKKKSDYFASNLSLAQFHYNPVLPHLGNLVLVSVGCLDHKQVQRTETLTRVLSIEFP